MAKPYSSQIETYPQNTHQIISRWVVRIWLLLWKTCCRHWLTSFLRQTKIFVYLMPHNSPPWKLICKCNKNKSSLKTKRATIKSVTSQHWARIYSVKMMGSHWKGGWKIEGACGEAKTISNNRPTSPCCRIMDKINSIQKLKSNSKTHDWWKLFCILTWHRLTSSPLWLLLQLSRSSIVIHP